MVAMENAHDLARVSFTGRFMAVSRRDALAEVRRHGGTVTTNVSRRTTLLVVGAGGWPLVADGSVSQKLRRAETLNAAGARIRIVPEEVFLEMLGLEERTPGLHKTYTFDQVVGLLGLDATTLRRWEGLGLIRSEEGRYDFQDIVSLRTIGDLIGRGVSPSALATTVRRLATVLPDIERPLAQLRLVEASGELLAEVGDALVAPDGQLMLAFGHAPPAPPDAFAAPAPDHGPSLRIRPTETQTVEPVVTSGGRDDHRGADAWLDYGTALEEADLFDEAIDAYRRASTMRPHFPEAHFNLGNVLRTVERVDDAMTHYRRAVEQDPTMSLAWYNLADLLDEHGRRDEAIVCLRQAIEAAPDFADAHYNLATYFEATGRFEDARRHLRRYLTLDPGSAWAVVARDKLAALERLHS